MHSDNYSNGIMFVTELLNLALHAWLLMLVLGALAHELAVPELAIGYWQSILVRLASGMLFNQVPVKRDLAWTTIIKGGRL